MTELDAFRPLFSATQHGESNVRPVQSNDTVFLVLTHRSILPTAIQHLDKRIPQCRRSHRVRPTHNPAIDVDRDTAHLLPRADTHVHPSLALAALDPFDSHL